MIHLARLICLERPISGLQDLESSHWLLQQIWAASMLQPCDLEVSNQVSTSDKTRHIVSQLLTFFFLYPEKSYDGASMGSGGASKVGFSLD